MRPRPRTAIRFSWWVPASSGLRPWRRCADCSPTAPSPCWPVTRTRAPPPRHAAHTTLCTATPRTRHLQELASLSDARVVGRKQHQMLMGGFPYVIEAVGAPQSVTEALRAVAHRGTVLLLGAAGISEVDLTPIWYKEAALVGSIDHTVDAASAPGLAGGPSRHSVDRGSTSWPPDFLPDSVVVTHEFPLDGYREAVETAIDRTTSHAIKVVFRP